MHRRRVVTLCVLGYTFGCLLVEAQAKSEKNTEHVVGWKTFTSRAGWTIEYPDNWRVGSCGQCPDPADPKVFVTFSDPSTEEMIMIERLADKPRTQTVAQWLESAKMRTVLTPLIRDEWITVNGIPALKVINGDSESTRSENIYLVFGSKTAAIRASGNAHSYASRQRVLSSFRVAKELR